MKLTPIHIKARDISDAWFQAIYKLLEVGFTYEIEHGSYVGDKRLEFDFVTIYITHPQTRPLEPEVPAQYNIPNPVEPGYIEQYVPYLMSDLIQQGEDYTYGSRIAGFEWAVRVPGQPNHLKINQIEHFIDLLKQTPNTNQAILQVAQPQDCDLDDPPCLRHIDMRIKDGKLIFYPYFRSWDLWGGFPANLGGVVYLQEYMADAIGVKPGPFVCASKGLHLYKYVWELAAIMRGKSLKEFVALAETEDRHQTRTS